MNQPGDKALGVALAIVVTCSLALTGFNAAHQYLRRRPPAPERSVSDWRTYSTAGHQLGSNAAPITIAIFSDYQCQACRAAFREIERASSKHPDFFKVVLRHFPMETAGQSERAARLAVCAEQQQRFRELNNVLLVASDSLNAWSNDEFGRRAGISDMESFDRCVPAESTTAHLTDDLAAGRALDVTRIPVLLINENQYVGITGLRALLKQHIKKAQDDRSQAALP